MPKCYDEISQDAIDRLHQRFLKRIADRAKKSVPADVENRGQLVQKTNEVLLLGARLRDTISTTKIKSMAYEDPAAFDALIAAHKSRLALDPWAHRRADMDAQFTARKDALLVEKTFAGRDRIYVKMNCDDEVSNTQASIENYLGRKKFTVTDYKKGYATDEAGKQRFKIGKLLKNHYLYDRFVRDETRTSQNKYIVFANGQKDLEAMSTRRAWASCMSSDGCFNDRVPAIIGSQTIIAYMISENDPEINDPLARILLKPYRSLKPAHIKSKAHIDEYGLRSGDLGHVFNYYMTKAFRGGYEEKEHSVILRSGSVYGLHSKSFMRAVDAFAADHFNKPRRGIYYFDTSIYADTAPRRAKVGFLGKIKDLHW
jgi:hypothetical protein